ncbi:hypothetical protein [Virgibacillus saliphilus]|uniref:hypothetical protein n=1 Tax=Virgibacillus saliphilus TaxID=2831674 RepID=UPI0021029CA8
MELDKDAYVKANNAEELLTALTNKEWHIIIQGDYKKEFEENTQLPLSEKEQMGFHLGSRGMISIWGEFVFQFINRWKSGSKQQKKIDSRIRKYNVKKEDEQEIHLSLRQLEY